jgi:hypothetical protein
MGGHLSLRLAEVDAPLLQRIHGLDLIHIRISECKRETAP